MEQQQQHQSRLNQHSDRQGQSRPAAAAAAACGGCSRHLTKRIAFKQGRLFRLPRGRSSTPSRGKEGRVVRAEAAGHELLSMRRRPRSARPPPVQAWTQELNLSRPCICTPCCLPHPPCHPACTHAMLAQSCATAARYLFPAAHLLRSAHAPSPLRHPLSGTSSLPHPPTSSLPHPPAPLPCRTSSLHPPSTFSPPVTKARPHNPAAVPRRLLPPSVASQADAADVSDACGSGVHHRRRTGLCQQGGGLGLLRHPRRWAGRRPCLTQPVALRAHSRRLLL